MSRPAATELLADLRLRGVRVRAEGEHLRLKAPPGAVQPNERNALERHKAEMVAQLELENRFLDLSLTEFERKNYSLEIKVPGLYETLWFVPTESHAAALGTQGIRRGRIWTARELQDLFNAPGITPEDALSIARAKATFSARVIDVRPADAVVPRAASNLPEHAEPEQEALDLGPPPREFD